MHRNQNLSYIAATDIHLGRALKILSDGTVREIESIQDPIVGWSMENVHSGRAVSIRTVFEGTMQVEVETSVASLHAGRMVALSPFELGKIRHYDVPTTITSTSVSDNGSDEVTYGYSAGTWTPDRLVDYMLAVRSGTNINNSYRVIGNTADTVTIHVDDVADFTSGDTFRMFNAMMGFTIRPYDSTVDKYADVLMLRQYAMTDRN